MASNRARGAAVRRALALEPRVASQKVQRLREPWWLSASGRLATVRVNVHHLVAADGDDWNGELVWNATWKHAALAAFIVHMLFYFYEIFNFAVTFKAKGFYATGVTKLVSTYHKVLTPLAFFTPEWLESAIEQIVDWFANVRSATLRTVISVMMGSLNASGVDDRTTPEDQAKLDIETAEMNRTIRRIVREKNLNFSIDPDHWVAVEQSRFRPSSSGVAFVLTKFMGLVRLESVAVAVAFACTHGPILSSLGDSQKLTATEITITASQDIAKLAVQCYVCGNFVDLMRTQTIIGWRSVSIMLSTMLHFYFNLNLDENSRFLGTNYAYANTYFEHETDDRNLEKSRHLYAFFMMILTAIDHFLADQERDSMQVYSSGTFEEMTPDRFLTLCAKKEMTLKSVIRTLELGLAREEQTAFGLFCEFVQEDFKRRVTQSYLKTEPEPDAECLILQDNLDRGIISAGMFEKVLTRIGEFDANQEETFDTKFQLYETSAAARKMMEETNKLDRSKIKEEKALIDFRGSYPTESLFNSFSADDEYDFTLNQYRLLPDKALTDSEEAVLEYLKDNMSFESLKIFKHQADQAEERKEKIDELKRNQQNLTQTLQKLTYELRTFLNENTDSNIQPSNIVAANTFYTQMESQLKSALELAGHTDEVNASKHEIKRLEDQLQTARLAFEAAKKTVKECKENLTALKQNMPKTDRQAAAAHKQRVFFAIKQCDTSREDQKQKESQKKIADIKLKAARAKNEVLVRTKQDEIKILKQALKDIKGNKKATDKLEETLTKISTVKTRLEQKQREYAELFLDNAATQQKTKEHLLHRKKLQEAIKESVEQEQKVREMSNIFLSVVVKFHTDRILDRLDVQISAETIEFVISDTKHGMKGLKQAMGNFYVVCIKNDIATDKGIKGQYKRLQNLKIYCLQKVKKLREAQRTYSEIISGLGVAALVVGVGWRIEVTDVLANAILEALQAMVDMTFAFSETNCAEKPTSVCAGLAVVNMISSIVKNFQARMWEDVFQTPAMNITAVMGAMRFYRMQQLRNAVEGEKNAVVSLYNRVNLSQRQFIALCTVGAYMCNYVWQPRGHSLSTMAQTLSALEDTNSGTMELTQATLMQTVGAGINAVNQMVNGISASDVNTETYAATGIILPATDGLGLYKTTTDFSDLGTNPDIERLMLFLSNDFILPRNEFFKEVETQGFNAKDYAELYTGQIRHMLSEYYGDAPEDSAQTLEPSEAARKLVLQMIEFHPNTKLVTSCNTVTKSIFAAANVLHFAYHCDSEPAHGMSEFKDKNEELFRELGPTSDVCISVASILTSAKKIVDDYASTHWITVHPAMAIIYPFLLYEGYMAFQTLSDEHRLFTREFNSREKILELMDTTKYEMGYEKLTQLFMDQIALTEKSAWDWQEFKTKQMIEKITVDTPIPQDIHASSMPRQLAKDLHWLFGVEYPYLLRQYDVVHHKGNYAPTETANRESVKSIAGFQFCNVDQFTDEEVNFILEPGDFSSAYDKLKHLRSAYEKLEQAKTWLVVENRYFKEDSRDSRLRPHRDVAVDLHNHFKQVLSTVLSERRNRQGTGTEKGSTNASSLDRYSPFGSSGFLDPLYLRVDPNRGSELGTNELHWYPDKLAGWQEQESARLRLEETQEWWKAKHHRNSFDTSMVSFYAAGDPRTIWYTNHGTEARQALARQMQLIHDFKLLKKFENQPKAIVEMQMPGGHEKQPYSDLGSRDDNTGIGPFATNATMVGNLRSSFFFILDQIIFEKFEELFWVFLDGRELDGRELDWHVSPGRSSPAVYLEEKGSALSTPPYWFEKAEELIDCLLEGTSNLKGNKDYNAWSVPMVESCEKNLKIELAELYKRQDCAYFFALGGYSVDENGVKTESSLKPQNLQQIKNNVAEMLIRLPKLWMLRVQAVYASSTPLSCDMRECFSAIQIGRVREFGQKVAAGIDIGNQEMYAKCRSGNDLPVTGLLQLETNRLQLPEPGFPDYMDIMKARCNRLTVTDKQERINTVVGWDRELDQANASTHMGYVSIHNLADEQVPEVDSQVHYLYMSMFQPIKSAVVDRREDDTERWRFLCGYYQSSLPTQNNSLLYMQSINQRVFYNAYPDRPMERLDESMRRKQLLSDDGNFELVESLDEHESFYKLPAYTVMLDVSQTHDKLISAEIHSYKITWKLKEMDLAHDVDVIRKAWRWSLFASEQNNAVAAEVTVWQSLDLQLQKNVQRMQYPDDQEHFNNDRVVLDEPIEVELLQDLFKQQGYDQLAGVTSINQLLSNGFRNRFGILVSAGPLEQQTSLVVDIFTASEQQNSRTSLITPQLLKRYFSRLNMGNPADVAEAREALLRHFLNPRDCTAADFREISKSIREEFRRVRVGILQTCLNLFDQEDTADFTDRAWVESLNRFLMKVRAGELNYEGLEPGRADQEEDQDDSTTAARGAMYPAGDTGRRTPEHLADGGTIYQEGDTRQRTQEHMELRRARRRVRVPVADRRRPSNNAVAAMSPENRALHNKSDEYAKYSSQLHNAKQELAQATTPEGEDFFVRRVEHFEIIVRQLSAEIDSLLEAAGQIPGSQPGTNRRSSPRSQSPSQRGNPRRSSRLGGGSA